MNLLALKLVKVFSRLVMVATHKHHQVFHQYLCRNKCELTESFFLFETIIKRDMTQNMVSLKLNLFYAL